MEPGGGLACTVHVAAREERWDPAARAPCEREQAACMPRYGVERAAGPPAGTVHPRACDDGGEVAVPFAILGEEDEMRSRYRRHRDLRPYYRAQPLLVRRLREGNYAAQIVVVGERERAVPQRGGALHELFGERRAIEERVCRVAVELHVAGSPGGWRGSQRVVLGCGVASGAWSRGGHDGGALSRTIPARTTCLHRHDPRRATDPRSRSRRASSRAGRRCPHPTTVPTGSPVPPTA